MRPSHITTMRWDMRRISGNSDEIMMIDLPSRDEVVEQPVDLLLGAHVDAAGGLVEDEDVAVLEQPLADDDLLLVAAGEVAPSGATDGVLIARCLIWVGRRVALRRRLHEARGRPGPRRSEARTMLASTSRPSARP